MDVVKAQLDRIKQQLAGLSATQRMLVGTLVAIMVLTLLYWGRYAGNPEMVPVLDQVLSEDDIGTIDSMLENKGIAHSVSGGKVMVPADQKYAIIADLMYAQKLPRNSKSAFEEMSKQLNPFSPNSEREENHYLALQMTLADIIRRLPGVSDAQVLISAKSQQRIEHSVMPTATVFLTTRDPSAVNKQLIAAAADGVAGTVPELTRGHVSVIINGISRHVSEADANPLAGGDDLIDLRQRSEERLEQKIRDQFAYINGLTATVTCDVENRSMIEHKHTYDTDHVISKPVEENTHSEETTNSAPPAADAGVGPNTSGANASGTIYASGGGAGNQSTTSTDEKVKNVVLPSDSEVNTQIPAGKDTVVSATVRVPRSYFVSIFKQQNPAGKEPDDAAIQAVATTELASIRKGVKTCVGLKADEDLSVDMYADAPVTTTLAMATTPSTSSVSLNTVTAYGKEIALGVLAVASLFMMTNMVKKSSPAPAMASAVAAEPVGVLGIGDIVAGEVGMSNATLDGMEMDEDAVRTQQMLEQVSTLVKENPDSAASLVKRWLNRS